MKRFVFLIITVIFLSACGGSIPVTSGDAAARATAGARAAADSRATLGAVNAAETAVVASTLRAIDAQAQSTREAVEVTRADQDIRERDLELANQSFELTRQAAFLEISLTSTKAAEEAALAFAITAAADEAARLDATRQHEQTMLEREKTINSLIPYAAAVGVVLLGGLFFLGWKFVHSRRPVQEVARTENTLVLVDNGRGFQPVTQMPNPSVALTDPMMNAPQLMVGRPSWQKFIEHRDDRMLPVGVDGATGEPIFLGRDFEPHLFIVGSTGAGKTGSGLIPYAVGMLGSGVHILLVNGRGADFEMLRGIENITIVPPGQRGERVFALQRLLETFVTEVDRRDRVLRDFGARSWHVLPPGIGEDGEILIGIDEFLSIILEAEGLMDEAETTAERAKYKRAVASLWRCLIVLTSEARKFGIYAAITATDPTARALGKRGMTVRDQMARMAFNMKNADASRKIINGDLSAFPNGSTGLPVGQFISNINGLTQLGYGFYPDERDVRQFVDSRYIPVNPLPVEIENALPSGAVIEEVPQYTEWTEENGRHQQIAPPPSSNTVGVYGGTAVQDARSLTSVIAEMKSKNDVERFLTGHDWRDRSYRPSGKYERALPALEYRASHMGCTYAGQMLSRTRV